MYFYFPELPKTNVTLSERNGYSSIFTSSSEKVDLELKKNYEDIFKKH